jgi:hypothetical protein
MDDWLEAAYEERYEGEDYNIWEENQVFLDNEGSDEDSDEESDEDFDEEDFRAELPEFNGAW